MWFIGLIAGAMIGAMLPGGGGMILAGAAVGLIAGAIYGARSNQERDTWKKLDSEFSERFANLSARLTIIEHRLGIDAQSGSSAPTSTRADAAVAPPEAVTEVPTPASLPLPTSPTAPDARAMPSESAAPRRAEPAGATTRRDGRFFALLALADRRQHPCQDRCRAAVLRRGVRPATGGALWIHADSREAGVGRHRSRGDDLVRQQPRGQGHARNVRSCAAGRRLRHPVSDRLLHARALRDDRRGAGFSGFCSHRRRMRAHGCPPECPVARGTGHLGRFPRTDPRLDRKRRLHRAVQLLPAAQRVRRHGQLVQRLALSQSRRLHLYIPGRSCLGQPFVSSGKFRHHRSLPDRFLRDLFGIAGLDDRIQCAGETQCRRWTPAFRRSDCSRGFPASHPRRSHGARVERDDRRPLLSRALALAVRSPRPCDRSSRTFPTRNRRGLSHHSRAARVRRPRHDRVVGAGRICAPLVWTAAKPFARMRCRHASAIRCRHVFRCPYRRRQPRAAILQQRRHRLDGDCPGSLVQRAPAGTRRQATRVEPLHCRTAACLGYCVDRVCRLARYRCICGKAESARHCTCGRCNSGFAVRHRAAAPSAAACCECPPGCWFREFR